MDDYEHKTIFTGIVGNKSAYIRELIRRGVEAANSEDSNAAARNVQLKQELYNKNEEIKQLKAQLTRFKNKLHGQTELNQAAQIDKLDIIEVEKLLRQDQHKRELVKDILKTLARDKSYIAGCRQRYNNECGQNLTMAAFSVLVESARQLQKENKL